MNPILILYPQGREVRIRQDDEVPATPLFGSLVEKLVPGDMQILADIRKFIVSGCKSPGSAIVPGGEWM